MRCRYGCRLMMLTARYSASATTTLASACGNVSADNDQRMSARASISGASPSGPPMQNATSRPSCALLSRNFARCSLDIARPSTHGIAGDGQSSGDATLPSPENVANGTLPHDYHADLKATSDPINFAPMDGQHGTVGTESVTYHWDASSNTLVATSDAGRGDIFKVVVDGGADNGNGNYQLTLLKPVMHASGNNENDATVELTYQVKDSSSDTARAS